jgi:hypothetical protein
MTSSFHVADIKGNIFGRITYKILLVTASMLSELQGERPLPLSTPFPS